jgi:hypothetical protein
MPSPEPQRVSGYAPLGKDFILTIHGCARCHGDGHEDVLWLTLTHPVEVGGHTLTHWASCPENGQPILMSVTE